MWIGKTFKHLKLKHVNRQKTHTNPKVADSTKYVPVNSSWMINFLSVQVAGKMQVNSEAINSRKENIGHADILWSFAAVKGDFEIWQLHHILIKT